MKRLLMCTAAALTLLLGGCATTIRSDVTTFHEWPAAQVGDKTYVLEAAPSQDDTLELRSYQNLVRNELGRLGFREAQGAPAALKVSMRFTTTDVPVRVLEPTFHGFHPSARFMFAHPFHRGYWGGRRYWGGGFYSPFYDPFWHAPAYQETVRHYYRREVQVAIKAADGKRLFDVTVHNTSREMSTPALMPALVHSAFTEFPGPSGVARRVELKREG